MATATRRGRNQNMDDSQPRCSNNTSFPRQPYQRPSADHPKYNRNQRQNKQTRSSFKDDRSQPKDNERRDQDKKHMCPCDRRAVVLRSKDFKNYLVQMLEGLEKKMDTWYPDEVVGADQMDWQPEVEIVLPQISSVVKDMRDLITSEDWERRARGAQDVGQNGICRRSRDVYERRDSGIERWAAPRGAVGGYGAVDMDAVARQMLCLSNGKEIR